MSRNTADIGRALELLREGLGPFVEREVERLPRNQIEDFIRSNSSREVRDKLRKTPIREWDVYVLLNLMQWRWREVFGNTLGRMERSFVGEAQDWRNKWAHQQMLTATDADVDRALDTTVRLLRAVKAETQAAEVARLWESRKASSATDELRRMVDWTIAELEGIANKTESAATRTAADVADLKSAMAMTDETITELKNYMEEEIGKMAGTSSAQLEKFDELMEELAKETHNRERRRAAIEWAKQNAESIASMVVLMAFG